MNAGQLRKQAEDVLDVVDGGGVAIIPLDVAYAILARTEAGIRKIFEVKRRGYDKPSGMFACLAHSTDLHLLGSREREIQRVLIEEHDLPFSVVAPYRRDHPLLADVDPFVLETSTKGNTMDMLLNAGPMHNALAELNHARGKPIFGSSANLSLTGSKYRVADIEESVRAAADIVIDHGTSKYANDEGLSSTIIDFRDFSVVRRGCCFDAIAGVLRDRFDIALQQ